MPNLIRFQHNLPLNKDYFEIATLEVTNSTELIYHRNLFCNQETPISCIFMTALAEEVAFVTQKRKLSLKREHVWSGSSFSWASNALEPCVH